MRPEPGQVLHFSEDPTITRFVPRAMPNIPAYVWAVDAARAPDYWFPRQCPRAMAWVTQETTDDDRGRILGPGGGDRVHAIEYRWLEALRTATLFAYRLPAAVFQPIGSPISHAQVATVPVEPLGPPDKVTDLLRLHEQAGIQLRILDNLWAYWDAVTTSSVGWSGIRLRNAKSRPVSGRA